MIAIACRATLKDGRQIWIPPNGRPFWTDYQPTIELTDEELAKYLPWWRG
jgi:hypothetical protein